MDENAPKLSPPHDSAAEQSVIGAMLIRPDTIPEVSEILERLDFYNDKYGLMFEAIVELSGEGTPADEVTLAERLRMKAAPPETSNAAFIKTLIRSVPSSNMAKHYATIVRDKSILRKIIRASREIQAECYEASQSIEDILAGTEKKMLDLVQGRSGDSRITPIKDDVIEALKKIQEAAKSDSYVTGVASGFEKLDEKTAGFQKSDLILIAARPSMGKTAFALNIAEYVAFREKKHCLIFSLEMSKGQLINRLLAMDTSVNSKYIRTGKGLTDEDWKALVTSAGTLGKSNMAIDATPGISVAEVRSKCIRYKAEHKALDLVIIDYLQIMTGDRSQRMELSKQQEVSHISQSLKSLARELDVPVIALSQLSRGPEQRPNHRPMLSDLRESGSIEQDADLVMFIYREDYYTQEESDKPQVADIIIAKHRNGETGTVHLAWMKSLTKFENMIYDDEEAEKNAE